jgi:hypothetical protein
MSANGVEPTYDRGARPPAVDATASRSDLHAARALRVRRLSPDSVLRRTRDRSAQRARRRHIGAALVVVACLPPVARAEQTGTEPAPPRGVREARCPPTITADERVPEHPPGWTVTQRKTGHRMVGVTFYDGLPSGGASLVYDETATSGDEWIATWHFTPGSKTFWIECRYEGTTMQLARPLPPTVTVCRVTYDKRIVTDPRHDEVRRLACE